MTEKPNMAGPLFGALVIGVGVGYFFYAETGKAFLALALGVGVAAADLIILYLISWMKAKFKS